VCKDSSQGFYYSEVLQSQKIFQFPVSHPDDRAIPSGCPSVTVTSARTTCHIVRTPDKPSIIRPDDVSLRPDPPLCREGSIQLASIRTFQQHVRTSLGTRPVSDSFQVLIKERSINRLDDVVSCLDARLLKARIAIQISPSGRLSAAVRTHVHQRRKLPIQLQLSGRLPFMVWTYAHQIWKLRVEHQPSGRSKPYKEITCSGHETVRTMCHPVRTRLLDRKDFPAKFSKNLVAQLSVRTAHIQRPDGAQVYFA